LTYIFILKGEKMYCPEVPQSSQSNEDVLIYKQKITDTHQIYLFRIK